MALIKDERLVTDPWHSLADDEAVPNDRPVIVSWKRFQAERAAWAGRGQPLGVRVPSDVPADAIAAELPHLALVALEFPKFADGRAFSTARLLRERCGFKGELRAVGEVLRDQLLFMARCGFDAFEIAEACAADALPAFREITVAYQPAADGALPAFRRHGIETTVARRAGHERR
jgi:uncharacterized protein (DUF934 family)